MKKRFFNFKSLFLVSFLAVAGIFSAGAFVVNKQTEEAPTMEKADATVSLSGTIFMEIPNWGSTAGKDCWIHFYGGSGDYDEKMEEIGNAWSGARLFRFIFDNSSQKNLHDGYNLQFYDNSTCCRSETAFTSVSNFTTYHFDDWATSGYPSFKVKTYQMRVLTVKYHGNGATSGSMSDYGFYGDIANACTLTNNAFARVGYNFVNWSTTPSGSGGQTFSNGHTFTQSELSSYQDGDTIDLYAQWSATSYGSVFFNLVTGDNADWYDIYYWDSQGGHPEWSDSRYGSAYTAYGDGLFYIYNPSDRAPSGMILRDKDNHSYQTNDITVPTGALQGEKYFQLYESWEASTPSGEWKTFGLELSFDKNSGTGTMTDQEIYALGGTQTIKANTFTRTGYVFAGWATSSGGAVVYTDGASLTESAIKTLMGTSLTKSITLYAKWTATYKVSIVVNDSDMGQIDVTSIKNVPSGTIVTTSGNTMTINGTTVTATAKTCPTEGYIFAFDEWDAPTTITGATTITARFKQVSGQTAAMDYCIDFNKKIGAICEASGPRDLTALKNEWDTQAANYRALATYIQYWVKTGSTGSSDIVNMRNKYRFVFDKYGSVLQDDFLYGTTPSASAVRDISPFSLFNGGDNDPTTIIIIVASSVSLLSITALSVLLVKKRKRKED